MTQLMRGINLYEELHVFLDVNVKITLLFYSYKFTHDSIRTRVHSHTGILHFKSV